jgi:hypothetical protein
MKNDRPQYLVVGLFLKYVGFEIDITGEKWWGILLMPPTYRHSVMFTGFLAYHHHSKI